MDIQIDDDIKAVFRLPVNQNGSVEKKSDRESGNSSCCVSKSEAVANAPLERKWCEEGPIVTNDAGEWTCPICTLLNKIGNNQCLVCGKANHQPKPSQPPTFASGKDKSETAIKLKNNCSLRVINNALGKDLLKRLTAFVFGIPVFNEAHGDGNYDDATNQGVVGAWKPNEHCHAKSLHVFRREGGGPFLVGNFNQMISGGDSGPRFLRWGNNLKCNS